MHVFSVPPLPTKICHLNRLVVACRENSVLSGHNCSDCKTPECVQLHVCVL